MVASIKEFGFKIPLLARSNGEVVDGHLRLKAAQKLGMQEVPLILCDEWSEAQVKAFRLLANRSVNWASWDEDLVALEIGDLKTLDFDLSLTGFDPPEIDRFLFGDTNAQEDDIAPEPPPEIAVAQIGDLYVCGSHRVLCGDATSQEAVTRLLGERKPLLMVCDPPYGISLDSEWRDRAGLTACGTSQPGYSRRTEGHRNTSMVSDTRADWSDAFALVPSLEVAYVWHASQFTREVLDGLLRIGFVHHQQIMGGSLEEKYDHPTQKPIDLMRRPILNHTQRGELVYDPFLGSGTTLAACEQTERDCYGLEIDPRYVDVLITRWQKLTGKQATLEGDGRTFDQVTAERRPALVEE